MEIASVKSKLDQYRTKSKLINNNKINKNDKINNNNNNNKTNDNNDKKIPEENSYTRRDDSMIESTLRELAKELTLITSEKPWTSRLALEKFLEQEAGRNFHEISFSKKILRNSWNR